MQQDLRIIGAYVSGWN